MRHDVAAPADAYKGAFSLTGTGVSGWAAEENAPRPLWLEILIDGTVLGCTRADLMEPKGCGFWYTLPHAALESGTELRVRVANTNVDIAPPLLLSEAPNTLTLQGEAVFDRGLSCSGWALDPMEPDRVLRLKISVDGTVRDEVVALESRYRPRAGDGHGFHLHLPWAFADGCEHRVDIRDDKNRALPGSPFTVRLRPSPADWVREKSSFSTEDRALLAAMLTRAGASLPCACARSGESLAAWKKAFPVPKPGAGIRVSLTVEGLPKKQAGALLKNQKGIALQAPGAPAYTLFMEESDTLHPNAVAHMIAALSETGADLVYADSERTDSGEPFFKPAWDEDRFFAEDYLGPFLVRKNILAKSREPGEETTAALRVRAVRAAAENSGIRHLPLLLSTTKETPPAPERLNAVRDWVRERDHMADVVEQATRLRVLWNRSDEPMVSIVIPTRDHADLLSACLASLEKTAYGSFEILIVDNGSTESDALSLLKRAAEKDNIRVLPYPGEFNYSAINNFAVSKALGDYICFLNNDTEATDPAWLSEMVSELRAQGKRAGCVGAKLLWPNGLVQHAGVLVGIHDLAGHIGNTWSGDEEGYGGINLMVCQHSAATAACLLTPKRLFTDLGGFDARRFPVAFNDVDYCLRVRALGKKIVVTPFATLLHRESASRGNDTAYMQKSRANREMAFFKEQWGGFEDPFYNPNLPLSTVTEPFDGLAVPPRSRHVR